MDHGAKVIQHGHWTTFIEKVGDKYRVTTISELRETQPQTFCHRYDSALAVAAQHMKEVEGL